MLLSHGTTEVIAVYRYEKTSTEDLAFEKDERLTILRQLTVYYKMLILYLSRMTTGRLLRIKMAARVSFL